MSIPNTYNPSDYQYLLRSLTQGSHIAKAESLKRFQILANSDKKQFAVYAKRIILALQDQFQEQREQINLHASMLVLEIINLNPKDIQYYIRTKILRKIVCNLGDPKPQVRKTSHYCILAYLKAFKSIDQIMTLYIQNGILSQEAQLRQKAINSLQSIIITDPKCLNWNSQEFKKCFQSLLQKLKDQSPFVQKAAEQCLLTLSRMEEIHTLTKKLIPAVSGLYRAFCDTQRELGNLQSLNIQENQRPAVKSQSIPSETSRSDKNLKGNPNQLQKISKQQTMNKQALIDKIQQIRRNSQTPKYLELKPQEENKDLLGGKQKQKAITSKSHRQPIKQPEKARDISPRKQNYHSESAPKLHPVILASKTQKIQNVFGKKLFDDLRNDRDWKVRLQAIEELETRFSIYKEAIETDALIKNLLPALLKLLTDQNFKIASISLKVFEQFLRIPSLNLEVVAPQVVQKLGDGKVVLRQGVARLIRSEYLRLYNPIWIDSLLDLLKKALNPVIKQQILGIIKRMYEDEVIKYPLEKIVQVISPLMQDPKTKIKIKTLDLLVQISSSTHKVDLMKKLLSNQLNQVYYQMFVEKIVAEMKHRVTPRHAESEPPPHNQSRSLSFPSLRKHKNSANNTTQSSLQKYAKTVDTRPVHKGNTDLSQKDDISISGPEKLSQFQAFEQKPRGSLTPLETIRKKPPKSYKRRIQRTIESKLAITQTVESDGLKPFSDPERQLRSLPNDLKSQDWQNAYDALTKLRRLLKFHSELFTASIGRPLTVETAKLVESLRSSLSKNAVITLGECAQVLGRMLDPQLQGIFSRLIRKTLDTNSFISEEVRKTLILLSTNCNQGKVLSLLNNYHTSRANPIKINLSYILQELANEPKVVQKQMERLISILVDFMGEGALQIRDRSKRILSKLFDQDKSGKVTKMIPSSILQKLKKKDWVSAMDSKIKEPLKQSLKEIVKEPSVASITTNKEQLSEKKIQLSPLKRKKILSFPKQFEQIDQLLLSCETTEWKTRQTALSKIAAIAKKFPSQMSQYRLSTRVIEVFAKQSNDPNSKVATNALTLFMQIVPLMPRLIQTNLSVLSNEIFCCFASHKSEVRELSIYLFDLIAEKVENWMLVQHLCSGALYGPAKGRANILVKLIKILPSAFSEKKQTVQKHVYSLINKLAEDPKGEIAPILKELILMTIKVVGEEANSSLKQQAKNLIST